MIFLAFFSSPDDENSLYRKSLSYQPVVRLYLDGTDGDRFIAVPTDNVMYCLTRLDTRGQLQPRNVNKGESVNNILTA